MVNDFQLTGIPRVVFGAGKLSELSSVLKSYGPWVLVLTGKKSFLESVHWGKLKAQFANEGIIWSHASIEGEPNPRMIDEIVNDHRDNVVDAIVSIGGGSVMDAGKAISAMLCERGSVKNFLEGVGNRKPSGDKVPFIAVPTTAGTGSEATKNAVVSQPGAGGFKKSLRHDHFIPDVAIIDPNLAIGLSPKPTAYTGMDTFTQLLEAYVSTKATPFTDALALQGLGYVKLGLEKAVEHGEDLEARSYMAYASFLSGVCLANAGLGLVHGFASAIGGRIEISHGLVCARLMEEVNLWTVERLAQEDHKQTAWQKYQKVGEVFGYSSEKAIWGGAYLAKEIMRLVDKFEIPRFADFGLKNEDLEEVLNNSSMKNHPVFFSKEECQQILAASL